MSSVHPLDSLAGVCNNLHACQAKTCRSYPRLVSGNTAQHFVQPHRDRCPLPRPACVMIRAGTMATRWRYAVLSKTLCLTFADCTSMASTTPQPAKRVIGLISGTSVDGIDAVLARISGHGPGSMQVQVEAH